MSTKKIVRALCQVKLGRAWDSNQRKYVELDAYMEVEYDVVEHRIPLPSTGSTVGCVVARKANYSRLIPLTLASAEPSDPEVEFTKLLGYIRTHKWDKRGGLSKHVPTAKTRRNEYIRPRNFAKKNLDVNGSLKNSISYGDKLIVTTVLALSTDTEEMKEMLKNNGINTVDKSKYDAAIKDYVENSAPCENHF